MAFWNKEKPKAQDIPEPEPAPVEVVSPAPEPQPLPQPPVEPVKKTKPAPNRKRPFDAHVWFSEAEQRKLERRVEQSGLSKGVFIRKAALENPIVIDPEKEKIIVRRNEVDSGTEIHPCRAGAARGPAENGHQAK